MSTEIKSAFVSIHQYRKVSGSRDLEANEQTAIISIKSINHINNQCRFVI